MSNVVSIHDLWGYIPYGLAFQFPDQMVDFLVPPSCGRLIIGHDASSDHDRHMYRWFYAYH